MNGWEEIEDSEEGGGEVLKWWSAVADGKGNGSRDFMHRSLGRSIEG